MISANSHHNPVGQECCYPSSTAEETGWKVKGLAHGKTSSTCHIESNFKYFYIKTNIDIAGESKFVCFFFFFWLSFHLRPSVHFPMKEEMWVCGGMGGGRFIVPNSNVPEEFLQKPWTSHIQRPLEGWETVSWVCWSDWGKGSIYWPLSKVAHWWPGHWAPRVEKAGQFNSGRETWGHFPHPSPQ